MSSVIECSLNTVFKLATNMEVTALFRSSSRIESGAGRDQRSGLRKTESKSVQLSIVAGPSLRRERAFVALREEGPQEQERGS